VPEAERARRAAEDGRAIHGASSAFARRRLQYPHKNGLCGKRQRKGRDDWGAGGDPIGAPLAPRSPAVLRPFSRSRRASPEPPRHQNIERGSGMEPRRGPDQAAPPLILLVSFFHRKGFPVAILPRRSHPSSPELRRMAQAGEGGGAVFPASPVVGSRGCFRLK